MAIIENKSFDSGAVQISRWRTDAIHLSHAISEFDGPISFPGGKADDKVRLHFGLHGDYDFNHKQLGQKFKGVGGRHNLMYSKGFDILVEAKSKKIETFGIEFPKELFVNISEKANDQLKLFCDAVLNGQSKLLSPNWKVVNGNMHKVIQEIRDCKYTDSMESLFLFSKSLELLVLSAEAHIQEERPASKFMKSSSDREKINAAFDIITQQVQSPPKLSALAKLVGLNEYKLKGGFKETFGITVYGHLRQQRLQLALQYLLDTDKTAAEISAMLGYSSPQHFNLAFKKHFGKTPSTIRKNP